MIANPVSALAPEIRTMEMVRELDQEADDQGDREVADRVVVLTVDLEQLVISAQADLQEAGTELDRVFCLRELCNP